MDAPPTRELADDVEPSAVRVVDGRGDAALIAAYEQHHDAIYGFLRRATRDDGVAEDLLQETFARLLTESRAGRVPGEVVPWLYRVATNLVISRGRRTRTAIRWLTEQRRAPAEQGFESAEATTLRHEWTSGVRTVLAGLPAEARTALLLSADGFSGREIAATIGRTEAATRVLMCRARQRMRSELEDRESGR
jgi:RNA polymerase sigma-70 factor (ECF subfamily)